MDTEFYQKIYSTIVDKNAFPTFEAFLKHELKALEEEERKRRRTPEEIAEEKKLDMERVQWSKKYDEDLFCRHFKLKRIILRVLIFIFLVLIPVLFVFSSSEFSENEKLYIERIEAFIWFIILFTPGTAIYLWTNENYLGNFDGEEGIKVLQKNNIEPFLLSPYLF